MDVNFEYYKIFYYVARYKNFTKAAQALGSSQPNVTRAMNCLEQQINSTLFVRNNRGIQLTPEGEKLYIRAYWKLHDKKKMLVARLKGYLDGLPPKTRKRIVLAMLAAFTVLALYTFGKAVYDIGRNDGSRIVTDHAGQVELSVKPENNHNVIPYLYGTDEE